MPTERKEANETPGKKDRDKKVQDKTIEFILCYKKFEVFSTELNKKLIVNKNLQLRGFVYRENRIKDKLTKGKNFAANAFFFANVNSKECFNIYKILLILNKHGI